MTEDYDDDVLLMLMMTMTMTMVMMRTFLSFSSLIDL